MPEMRRYKVSQIREVSVQANCAGDAVVLAEAAFTHGQDINHGIARDKGPTGIWGNTTSKIREVALSTKEVRPGE